MPEPEQERAQALFAEWLAIRARILAIERELVELKDRALRVRDELLEVMRVGDLSGDGPLSSREQQVLMGMQQKKSNKEIGNELHIGERTVKFHVSNILAKLGKVSRHDL